MGHMTYQHTKPYEDWFWKKNRIELLRAWVHAVDLKKKQLVLANDEYLTYDKLVLATGSKSNKFGWPGQDLDGVQGLYSYQDLENMEDKTKGIAHGIIIGGGLIGVEMAEMLHSRGIHVTLLIREKHFWDVVLPRQEAEMIDRHLMEQGIDLRTETELKEIINDGNGRAAGVVTNKGETLHAPFIGLTVGVSPNVDFLKDSGLEIERGILVNEYLETNQPDVYAAGDCVQLKNPPVGRRPIEAVWYVGRIMGETLGQTLAGKRTRYEPGTWFNSAKFFDIEYQTYGAMPSVLPDGQQAFYWEHANGKKCIHMYCDKKDKTFRGINTFGIRLRHELFDDWLNKGKTIDYVVAHLNDAWFDPELYRSDVPNILAAFNNQFDAQIQPKKKNWNRILKPILP